MIGVWDKQQITRSEGGFVIQTSEVVGQVPNIGGIVGIIPYLAEVVIRQAFQVFRQMRNGQAVPAVDQDRDDLDLTL